MATTTPDNLRTPNPGDPYNLVPDLATLANDVQTALNNKQSNVFKGTAAQRAAFLSTAVQGMLWQDTDGIKMLWRRDVSAWLPAVWRWAGTTSQMNGFTQAPNGFEWFNTTTGSNHLKISGVWRQDNPWVFKDTLTPGIGGGGQVSGWFYTSDSTYTFPGGLFSTTPKVTLSTSGSGFIITQLQSVTSTTVVYAVARLGAAPAANTRVELQAWV